MIWKTDPYFFLRLIAQAEQENVERPEALRQIQTHTAFTWAARAAVAAQRGGRPQDVAEYAHEAIEHAALCGDDEVLTAVRGWLVQHGVAL